MGHRNARSAAQALLAGVDVDAVAAGEAGEGEAAVGGEVDGEGGGGSDADEDRRAGDGGLLDELEGEAPADAEDPVVEGKGAVEERAADDLVHRVVAPDVLADAEQLARRREEASGVQAAGAGE